MPTYSHSQLSTYETCPHQYRLAYIDKIKVETEGIEAFMGSRAHETMEKLYRRLGEKCVSDYYKRYYPFDQGKTLGLEENIFFLLEEEKGYWIRGVVDRLTLL